MFSTNQLFGKSLPSKTLCLSFDDGPGETIGTGPGPKTLKLAEYLSQERISATFFMVGKFIEQYPHILSKVTEFGHIIGNHTYSHPQNPYIVALPPETILLEISTTNELIRNYIPNNTVYFRAPYGIWEPRLSELLNQKLKNDLIHLGPFNWDINGADYDFWLKHKSAEECASRYLKEIELKNHGIVLMHDSTADIEEMKINNR